MKTKTINTIGLLALLCSMAFSLHAQVALPYFSGFDDSTQLNGWVEYKTAATQHSHWSIASANAFSAPNMVGHDYSPSTGITLTDNWFVSPGFSVVNGGTLDSVRYMFSGFSTPDSGDTVGIFVLRGSQDPTAANSQTLLYDFRGADYVADFTYRIKTNIAIPPSSEMNYLAIRYRNTDCSSKWLTVGFDNIAISGMTSGLPTTQADDLNIYPNPTNGQFVIEHHGNVSSITIQNVMGQTVYQSPVGKEYFSNTTSLDLSNHPIGIYLIKLQQASQITTKKIVLQ